MPQFIVPSLKELQASCRFEQVRFRQPIYQNIIFCVFFLHSIYVKFHIPVKKPYLYDLSTVQVHSFLHSLCFFSCHVCLFHVSLCIWEIENRTESEAVFLHLPAHYEHLVLGRGVNLFNGSPCLCPHIWVPVLRDGQGCLWLHMYVCQSGWPVYSVPWAFTLVFSRIHWEFSKTSGQSQKYITGQKLLYLSIFKALNRIMFIFHNCIVLCDDIYYIQYLTDVSTPLTFL